MDLIDLFSLIETSIILLTYSLFLGFTYYKIGFSYLGIQEHCTICVFEVTELANLFVFTWVLITHNHEVGYIIDGGLCAVVNLILLYYSFQMRIVQFKLESEDHATYFK